jgi:histidinol-phosphate aminotransferase
MTRRDEKSAIPNAFIQAMPPWTPASSPTAAPTIQTRRMNLNESPYPPSPKAIEAMRDACGTINRYPDANWRELTAALAARTGVPDHLIVVGNGSDELIASATRVALTPGDEVIAPAPSFGSFAKGAAIQGAKLVTVPVRTDGACDVDAMIAAVTDRTRLVFLVTPNNPTGGMLQAGEISRLAQELPDSALLVLDEAYHEFAMQAGGDDPLEVMKARTGPWAIFRSFSKAYGLAGVRVGYMLCGSEAVAGGFQLARNAFTVNGVAQAGALAALEDEGHMRGIVSSMARERNRLSAGLRNLDLSPLPSVGNFVAVATPRPAGEVIAGLRDMGILIAGVPGPGFENHIRITVGLAEDTDAVLPALQAVLSA